MPRITFSKDRFNSTNFSGFYPGIASSPLNEDQVLDKTELEQHLQNHYAYIQKVGDENKKELLKYCNEAFEEIDKCIEECLSNGDFDFPITSDHLKVARAMFKKGYKKAGVSEFGMKISHIITDDADNQDYSGETMVNKNVPVNEQMKQVTVLENDKEKNKQEPNNARTTSCDEESDNVFKKPTGVSRKTRQASRTMFKEFQTPKRTGCSRGYNIAKVTPGPNIDRPLSVLRRPVPGEMAVSMNGSPLVTTHDNISVPQMSIPLSNGRTLTYLANEALDPDESICGEIDQETQERLTVFYKLLERKIKKYNGS